MKYYYLLLDIAALSFPFIRSFEPKIYFISRLRLLLPGIALAASIYIPWDIFFTKEGVWGFNNNYLSGLYIVNLPIEEWLFFIIIPYCCFFIYEVTLYFFKLPEFKRFSLFHYALATLLFIIGSLYSDLYYTSVTFILCAVVLLLITHFFKTARWNHFWITYLICLIPFLLMNGALTGSFTPDPVVWYDNNENLGIRLFTIPVEDTIYLLCYLLLIFWVYEKKSQLR